MLDLKNRELEAFFLHIMVTKYWTSYIPRLNQVDFFICSVIFFFSPNFGLFVCAVMDRPVSFSSFFSVVHFFSMLSVNMSNYWVVLANGYPVKAGSLSCSDKKSHFHHLFVFKLNQILFIAVLKNQHELFLARILPKNAALKEEKESRNVHN